MKNDNLILKVYSAHGHAVQRCVFCNVNSIKHKQKYKYDFEVPLLTYTSLLDIASLSKIEVRIPRYIQVRR